MGPRSRDRGIGSFGGELLQAAVLQWGRDHVIAEFAREDARPDHVPPLQWGRDHVIAEFAAVGAPVAMALRLQWGRDHVIAEFRGILPG